MHDGKTQIIINKDCRAGKYVVPLHPKNRHHINNKQIKEIMKALKYLALLIVALCAATSCSSDNNCESCGVDTVQLHSFDGYIYVTSKYIPRTYYGKNAKLAVCKAGDENVIKFSDPTWGVAEFTRVKIGTEMSGTGNITLNYGGKTDTYGAVISGTTVSPIITIPGIMGGCTIEFYTGKPSMADVAAGDYEGMNQVTVGGSYTYKADNIIYSITANEDSTINIAVPQYSLANTIMGDLTLGAYIIKDVAYDEANDCFYREYGKDGLSQELTAKQNGVVTMQGNYTFTEGSCITVRRTLYGLQVDNSFQLGKMPFPIVTKFESILPTN